MAITLNGTGTVSTDASGNMMIGTTTPYGRLVVASATGTYNGIAMRNNYANASNYAANYFDSMGENGLPASSIIFDLNADGSSGIYMSTQPAGSRTVDRRLVGFRLDQNGYMFMNSGYGSAGVAFGCRAWANINASSGTPVSRASGNVSSYTDFAVGQIGITFATAMPDANYIVVISHSHDNTATGFNIVGAVASSTTACRVGTFSANWLDVPHVYVAVFR